MTVNIAGYGQQTIENQPALCIMNKASIRIDLFPPNAWGRLPGNIDR
ncbi:MAG: hypothetical protein H8E57_09460 [Candidatus Cloacimonetes bacterium]|nr:hypothetical protein [Candidatus Cloacimonadota bacterium]